MSLKNLYFKACLVMQWNVGLAKGNLEEIIRKKRFDLSIKWFPLNDNTKSIADPFIFRTLDGNMNIIYEEFSMVDLKKYGKIMLRTVDEDFNPVFDKEILDTQSHISYPFVFAENNKTYIIPESNKKGTVYCYEYDFENKCLINEQIIIANLALLDSTIFKHNNKYWLFATIIKNQVIQNELNIYFADSLFGPYKEHPKNPVKKGLNGTRPAGNIIKVDGELYRPAQNCAEYYGKSISINKITNLNENEFSEEPYFELTAEKNSDFESGLHTINSLDNIIVVDGIKMLFRPMTKLKNYFKKKFF